LLPGAFRAEPETGPVARMDRSLEVQPDRVLRYRYNGRMPGGVGEASGF
jgi:hypothetical protein